MERPVARAVATRRRHRQTPARKPDVRGIYRMRNLAARHSDSTELEEVVEKRERWIVDTGRHQTS